MTSNDRQSLENMLALREKSLDHKERRYTLGIKQFRLVGATIGAIVVFALCFLAVFFGGFGIICADVGTYGKCKCEHAASKPTPTDEAITNQSTSAESTSEHTANTLLPTSQPMPENILAVVSATTSDGTHKEKLPEKSIAIITPNDKTTIALHNGTSEKELPYLPITALILKGFLVLAGLCVAACTVRIIASTNNDD